MEMACYGHIAKWFYVSLVVCSVSSRAAMETFCGRPSNGQSRVRTDYELGWQLCNQHSTERKIVFGVQQRPDTN